MMPDMIEIPDHLHSRLERLAADRDQAPGEFAASLLGVAVAMMERQEGDELRALMDRKPFSVPLERDPAAAETKSALCHLDIYGEVARAVLARFVDGADAARPPIQPAMILPLLDAVSNLDLARRDGNTENAAAVTRRLLDIWNGTA